MNKIKFYLTLIAVACSLSAHAVTYSVTNNMAVPFIVSTWTNSNGTNITLLSSNVPPGTNAIFTANTNGYAGVGVQATNASMSLLVRWTNAPFGSAYVGQLFNIAITNATPAYETVPQSQTLLRAYFLAGARPNQANYWEFIDTMFWYINSIYASMLAAQESARQAGQAYLAIQELNFTGTSTNITLLATNGYNISSIYCTNSIFNYLGSDVYTVHVKLTFATAFAGTDYVVRASAPGAGLNHLWIGVPDYRPVGEWGCYYYPAPTNNINTAYTVGYSNSANFVWVRFYSGRAWTDIDGAKIKLRLE